MGRGSNKESPWLCRNALIAAEQKLLLCLSLGQPCVNAPSVFCLGFAHTPDVLAKDFDLSFLVLFY